MNECKAYLIVDSVYLIHGSTYKLHQAFRLSRQTDPNVLLKQIIKVIFTFMILTMNKLGTEKC